MSVEEVAGRLKFAQRQITALEEGNFDQLPEMAFVRGFVRSYAKLMQIDDAPLLAALPSAPAYSALAEKQTAGDFMPTGSSARQQNILWIGGALGVALLIGILFWGHDGGQTAQKTVADAKMSEETKPAAEIKPAAESQPVAVVQPGGQPGAAANPVAEPQPVAEAKPAEEIKPAAKAKPGEAVKHAVKPKAAVETKPQPQAELPAEAPHVPSVMPASGAGETLPGSPQNAQPGAGQAAGSEAKPKAPQAPVHAGGKGLLRLDFDEDSWVEIKDGEGKTVLSKLGVQGSGVSVRGTPPFSVTIGNAQGVRLYYKGAPVNLEPYTSVNVAHVTLE